MPGWFRALRHQDEQVRALWEGRGKPDGRDVSNSGYDFSLARRLLRLGHTDVAELATILAARQEMLQSGKGYDYVVRTVSRALLK